MSGRGRSVALSWLPMRWLALFSLCLVPVACGGSTTQSATGGTGGASTGGGPTNGGSGAAGHGTGGGAGVSSACGSVAPANGSPCQAQSTGLGNAADCSFGDDPRPHCRTLAVCSNGTWTVTPPGDECRVPPRPEACPVSPPTPATACTDATLRCWYDDGAVCSCSDCRGGSQYPLCQTIDPPEWACVKPSAGCPNPPPQAGSICTDPNLQCGTSCELPIRCEDGVWKYGQEMCPICAAPDTPIATPGGDRPIAELRVGELVYSVDNEAIVAVPIARIGSTPVVNHRALRLTLSNGAVLEVSPGHPTVSGGPVSALVRGASIDGVQTLVSSELVSYRHERTYDILPRSSSGAYFAGGAELGSSLRPPN
jgi:hypothetical protein